MGNAVNPLIGLFRVLLACFLALLSFSYPASVAGSGPTSGWPLKDHPDFRSLAYKINELETSMAQLTQAALKTSLLENHPFVKALVGKIETLEMRTIQHAEEIKDLEVKITYQIEEIQHLKSTVAEQEMELTLTQKQLNSSLKAIDETIESNTNALKGELRDMEQVFEDTMVQQEKDRIQVIQGLNSTLMEQEYGLAKVQETMKSFERDLLGVVQNKVDALKFEMAKTEQLLKDAMTTQERERLQEVQGLNNTLVEQGKDLAQTKEKLKSLEKDVATEALGDSPVVVNLSDYKGGRLMVKTIYDRILAFQPVNSGSLETALKFIKIINVEDGTYVTLDDNKTLNPDVRHSDLAYKTIYTKGNRAVIEFSDAIPDGISIKISKAIECPYNLGAETHCARVADAESCYCAVSTKRSWQEQTTFCETKGFSLVTLESAEEEKAVTAIWGSLRFWMSLTSRNKEETWVWDASGATLASSDYANWKKGQPDSKDGNENCAEWRPWVPEWPVDSGWNDNSCNVKLGAICERHPSSSFKVPSSCADLRRAGQSVSGLYQVQTDNNTGSKEISTVLCDMSKDFDDKGFETLLGHIDVKPTDFIQHSSKVPNSCADLRRAGQSISGLYHVQTNSIDTRNISTVFCDMSKGITDEGLETLLGYIDAKPRDYIQYSSLVPNSCADLRRAGHSSSGLYQVQSNDRERLSNVFCDMTKDINDEGLERLVGYMDVKPIDFVQHTSKVPSSCEDLRRVGQSISGLYQVQLNNSLNISTVFCDMSKATGDKGFETLVGYIDMKSLNYLQYSSKVPNSCADLRNAGQSTSGLYQVQSIGSQRISSVFCDMSKDIADEDHETLLGFIDVKPRDFVYHSWKIPSSCADLQRAGQSTSGLYQVLRMNTSRIATVFCDMSKSFGSKDFQTYVGMNDVKRSLVHFLVARVSKFRVSADRIRYERATLNLGNAMNITSGVFTAPKAGIYSFTFTFVDDSSWGVASVRHNGNVVAKGLIYFSGGASSVHVAISLNAGDVVDTLTEVNLLSATFSGSILVEL